MSRDYRALQAAGNRAGLEKLKQNEQKKGFEEIDIDYAANRIDDELDELCEELAEPIRNYPAIRHEAGDIRNFCDMIILKCDQIIKEGE